MLLFDDSVIDKQVRAFVVKWKTAALATVSDRGLPHAANINFACDDDLNFYWVSKPTSAHSVHLAAQPGAALSLYAHVRMPNNNHGMQVHGRVVEIQKQSPQDKAALEIYAAKYPFVKLPGVREKIAQETFYKMTPTWLRWIDNRRGFGWKIVMDLPQAASMP